MTWNVPPDPVNKAGVLVYGPCTTGELCSVNELAVSRAFVELKDMTAFVPTIDTLVKIGGEGGVDALTVRTADGVTVPAG